MLELTIKVNHVDHQTESIKLRQRGGGGHHNNEFQNSDRPSVFKLLKLKKKKEKENTYASILPLSPRLIIATVLHPEWKAINQRISTNL